MQGKPADLLEFRFSRKHEQGDNLQEKGISHAVKPFLSFCWHGLGKGRLHLIAFYFSDCKTVIVIHVWPSTNIQADSPIMQDLMLFWPVVGFHKLPWQSCVNTIILKFDNRCFESGYRSRHATTMALFSWFVVKCGSTWLHIFKTRSLIWFKSLMEQNSTNIYKIVSRMDTQKDNVSI